MSEILQRPHPPVSWTCSTRCGLSAPNLFVEYDSAGFVPKWLFDVMMLGKDLIIYGETGVMSRIGRDIQRLWCVQKEKDPSTVPFYHAELPVYSWR